MIKGLPIAGEFTRVRRLRVDDLRAFQAYRTDPAIARYQGWSIQSDGDAEAFLASMANLQNHDAGSWLQLGIALPRSDLLIGDVGIGWKGANEPAEIGYSLAAAYHGQGFATDAVATVCRWVFRHYDTDSIIGITDQANVRSVKLLQRLNFEHTDTLETKAVTELVYTLRRSK
jgi:RimJ/RimL family protein N-acetyltransferase